MGASAGPRVLSVVAGVGRLHFASLSPAPRALEVHFDVSWLYRIHFEIRRVEIEPARVLPDVAGVARLHFGSLSSARRAPEVSLDLLLLHLIYSDLAC